MSPDAEILKKLPVDVYVRVSDVAGREGENFTSPEVQEEKARQLLALKDLRVGEVFVDLDESGRKMNRPEFNKAMQRIREGKSGGIAVHRLDRFARNVQGLLDYVEEIESHGAVFLCVEPNINTADPVYGEFLLTLFGAIARMESQKIRANWGIAQAKAIERGVGTAQAAFGYVKGEDGRYQVDPERGPVATEIFERRARGETQQQIVDWLTETGVTKARPWNRKNGNGDLVAVEKPWSTDNIREILKNEVYLGVARRGHLRNEDAHPALVSRELFQRVQAQRGRAHHEKRRGSFLLTGYVVCGACGGKMTYSTSGNGKYSFLICRSGKGCPDAAGIAASALEPFVAKKLAEAVIVEIKKPRKNDERLAAARARVERAETELVEFEEAWPLSGTIDPIDAAKVLGTLRQKVEEAEAALVELPTEEEEDILFTGLPAILIEHTKARVKALGGAVTFEDGEGVDRLKASAAQTIEQGLTGDELAWELLWDIEDEGYEPELLDKIRQYRRGILKRFLDRVTVTGKATEKGYRGQETEASVAARVEVRTK